MGKASRTKVEASRREKIAAQQQAARRSDQRRRIFIASGSIIVVLAIVVVFVVVKLSSNSSTTSDNTPNGPTGSALTSLIKTTTSVPASTLNAVGKGGGQVLATPEPIKGAALTANGKPEMLYIGAEYCPYCAAERWAMVVALSRFGTFTGLGTVHSAKANGAGEAEPYPDTPTWTFVHATFTSSYLTFTPVEIETNIPDKSTGEYTLLETPTKAEDALQTKYDAPPNVPSGDNGAIPFIDFGNKYMIAGASYNPGDLSGLTWAQVAADLSNPNSSVAKAIDGTANYITAAICSITGNAPASACTSTVQSLESQI
jgi:Domain of unknown function (DUF929)